MNYSCDKENDFNSTNMYNILDLSNDSCLNSSRNLRRETADPLELDDLLKNLNDSGSSAVSKNDYFGFGSVEEITHNSATKKISSQDEISTPCTSSARIKSSSKKSRNSTSCFKKNDPNAFVKIFTASEELSSFQKMHTSSNVLSPVSTFLSASNNDLTADESLNNISNSSCQMDVDLSASFNKNKLNNSNDTAVDCAELIFDDSFKQLKSRRDTMDSVDLAGLLKNIDDDDDDETLESSNSIKKELKKSKNRDTIDPIELKKSVQDLLDEHVENKSMSRDSSNVSSMSSREDNNSRNDTKDDDEYSECNDTATYNGSCLLDKSSASNDTLDTIDVIESIDALLLPHKEDLLISGGKFPTPIKSSEKKIKIQTFEKQSTSPCTSSLRRSPRSKTTPLTNDANSTYTLSPAPSTQMLMQISNLKSCLKSKIKPEKSSRKNVIFGSPNVAEFNKFSPTTSMTPMSKNQAKQLFSMNCAAKEKEDEKVDELTEENSRILDQWDRLTNVSEGSKESDDADVEFNDIFSPMSLSSAGSCKRRRRRQSKIHTDTSDIVSSNHDSIDSSNISNTVALPSNLRELINDNMVEQNGHCSYCEEDNTEALEGDLHSLLQNVNASTSDSHNVNPKPTKQSPHDESLIENDVKVTEKSFSIDNDSTLHFSEIDEDVTTALETGLASLIEHVNVHLPVEPLQHTEIICDSANEISSTKCKLSENQSLLKNRLRMLNAGARQNALVQCATPSTINHLNRLSIGMKRHSMIACASVNKEFNNSKRQRYSMIENSHPSLSLPMRSEIPVVPKEKVVSPKKPFPVVCIPDTKKLTLTLDNVYKSHDILFPRMPEVDYNLLSIAQNTIQSATSVALKNDLLGVYMNTFQSSIQELKYACNEINCNDSNSWNKISSQTISVIETSCDSTNENDGLKSYMKNLSDTAVKHGQKVLLDYENAIMSSIVENLNHMKVEKSQEIQNILTDESRISRQSKEEIESLCKKIENAKARLSMRKHELTEIQQNISILIESTKNEIVELVGDDENCHAYAIEKRLVEGPLVNPSSSFDEILKTASILNKLTYCRLISYQSYNIKFEVTLSTNVVALLEYINSESEDKDKVVVENVNFNIVSDEPKNLTQAEQIQYEFSKLYFSYMKKLCMSCFSDYKTLSYIPRSIQNITGYVLTLRKILAKVHLLSGKFSDSNNENISHFERFIHEQACR